MGKKKSPRPQIKEIWALSGSQSGAMTQKVSAGTVLLIKGKYLGEKPKSVSILFDEIKVQALPVLFSPNMLVVQTPFPEKSTKQLRIRLGDQESTVRKLAVHSKIDPSLPGQEIIKLYEMMDVYAFLLGSVARKAPISDSRRPLMDVVVDFLNGARNGARLSVDMLMQWQDYQDKIDVEPIRTLQFMDNYIGASNAIGSVVSMIGLTLGPFGWLKSGVKNSDEIIDGLLQDAGDLWDDFIEVITPIFKKGSEYIEEHTKLFDGLENGLKVATPSLSAEAGAGVDVSFSNGEAFSAVVRGIDGIGQILGQEAGETETEKATREIKEAIGKLEAKADIQQSYTTVIIESIQKQEVKGDRISEKLDILITDVQKIEEKSERQSEQIAILEQKSDIIEVKIDRIEEKTDRQEGKLDILEGKADRQETKLDRIEEKEDRQEEKLDKLEGKADRQEKKLDRLEQKIDKQEQKLDKQESKLDRLEKKADRQESKLDKLEGKADKAELKLDRQEGKLDKLEKKADKQESKLDKLEGKADKQEHKLDKIEAKIDRYRIPAPATDSSIASQRGGNINITAAIATIKSSTGRVYMKFAVNVGRDKLDDSTVYTPWKNFGIPNSVIALVDISIDLQYQDGSNTIISALLTARAASGKVFHRSFENIDHRKITTASNWSDWEDFLDQP